MKYLIILSIFCLLLQACISKECRIPNHDFEIPATLSPAKDTFNIGDTITIISNFPNQVYDKNTDKYYSLDNFKFYPETGIYKIDTVNSKSNLLDFEIIVDSIYNYNRLYYSDGTNSIGGQYNYNNNEYDLLYKIIPIKKGLFYLEFGSSVYPISPDQEFEGKCRNTYSDVSVKMNEGVDNNIVFLNDSPDPHYNNWILQKPDDRFHRFGGYCFHVK